MKIRFYPYDFSYKIKDEKVLVHLYGKLEDNTKICVVHEHKPYFYTDTHQDPKFEKRLKLLTISHASGTAKVLQTELVEKEFIGEPKKFWKVFVNIPMAVPIISKEIQGWGVTCYENNILFVHRYLRDMGIVPMTLVEVEGEFIEHTARVPVFAASSVLDGGKEHLTSWKILAVDIETYAETREINPKKNPILMVAFYGVDEQGKEFKKVITWRNFKHKLDYLEHVADEVELLERFRQVILEYKPDIITGYFTDGFDFPYLRARADKYNIKLDLGADHSELNTGRSFREGESRITGTLHLDMLKFIKYIFGKNLRTDSFSLDAVSRELLGSKKHDVNITELAHIWDTQPDKLSDFCEYNLHDAHLTYTLCSKLLPDMIEFTKIIGLPTFDVTRMRFSRLVESYILKRAIEFNVVAPNKPAGVEMEQRMEEHIQGAFVFEPKPGLYEEVIVFDFRSLYPTIITAHNISPEGLKCSCCKDKPHVPERAGLWFCTKKKFLPSVLERLILRRVSLKRLIKESKEKGDDSKILEARSYALKILANSFYGYLSFFGARWYSFESAAATTAYARNYIKDTIKQAEEKGFQVIYADTDSCFLLLGEKIKDEAMQFMNEINFDLPGHMELEFDGFYPRGLFVAQKGSEKGAKKKYALLGEDGKLKITGFETVRRNWSPIAKEVQEQVLKLVLQDKTDQAVKYIKGVCQDLKDGKIPLEKVVIKTQITRDISKYTSIGPHVAVAKRMIQKKIPVGPGTLVEYVIGPGRGLIRERAKLVEELEDGEYDSDYYLNHQIIPAVSGILAVLGYTEDQIFAKSSQVGLGTFF